MLTIPPHTSHKLQPLDRGVFGPFKSYYNTFCQNWSTTHPAKPITVYEVGYLVGQAYPLAFTPKNILSGFSVSGLWPINSETFNDSEYAGSLIAEREEPIGEPVQREENVLTTPPLLAATVCSGDIESMNMPSTSKDDRHSVKDVASTPNYLETSHKVVSNNLMDSLEKIRPYPKAERKIKKKGGRKPGRFRVLTDTPEKKPLRWKSKKFRKGNVDEVLHLKTLRRERDDYLLKRSRKNLQ